MIIQAPRLYEALRRALDLRTPDPSKPLELHELVAGVAPLGQWPYTRVKTVSETLAVSGTGDQRLTVPSDEVWRVLSLYAQRASGSFTWEYARVYDGVTTVSIDYVTATDIGAFPVYQGIPLPPGGGVGVNITSYTSTGNLVINAVVEYADYAVK